LAERETGTSLHNFGRGRCFGSAGFRHEVIVMVTRKARLAFLGRHPTAAVLTWGMATLLLF
jgi:hypothetical protein